MARARARARVRALAWALCSSTARSRRRKAARAAGHVSPCAAATRAACSKALKRSCVFICSPVLCRVRRCDRQVVRGPKRIQRHTPKTPLLASSCDPFATSADQSRTPNTLSLFVFFTDRQTRKNRQSGKTTPDPANRRGRILAKAGLRTSSGAARSWCFGTAGSGCEKTSHPTRTHTRTGQKDGVRKHHTIHRTAAEAAGAAWKGFGYAHSRKGTKPATGHPSGPERPPGL